MRFLPFVMIGFMILPILIWFFVQVVVLGDASSVTRFAAENWVQILGVGTIAVFALVLLGGWMSRMISRSER